ncbi:MAG: hypothetical protein JWO13_1171 [Acidobacteriales bacterium]|nr:hypothetical protein [Terriglobales bacterium]
MSTRKPLAVFVLGLSFLCCLLLAGCTSRVIVVRINNASAAPIRNIEVTFNGGSYGVSSLAPGKTHQNHIKPFGTSTLEVAYDDASGKRKTQAGPRIAKNDAGTTEVTITNTGAQWTGSVSGK